MRCTYPEIGHGDPGALRLFGDLDGTPTAVLAELKRQNVR